MHKYRNVSPAALDWIVSHTDASDLLWYIARRNLTAWRFVA